MEQFLFLASKRNQTLSEWPASRLTLEYKCTRRSREAEIEREAAGRERTRKRKKQEITKPIKKAKTV